MKGKKFFSIINEIVNKMINSHQFYSFHEFLNNLCTLFHSRLQRLNTIFELLFDPFILLLRTHTLFLKRKLQFPQPFL